MADPVAQVWNALQSGASPIVVVYYADLGLRSAVVDEVVSIAPPDWVVHRCTSVVEALEHPDRLVLLCPQEERTVIEDLDGIRDAFAGRSVPVVLFLLRDGDGARYLRDTLGLVGWVRGSEIDPDLAAAIDEQTERERFEAQTGATVEEWLGRYRAGLEQNDPSGLATTYWALLLERQ